MSGSISGVLTAPDAHLAHQDALASIADGQARAANATCYAVPDVTGTYAEDPYHAVRRSIAARLLQSAADLPAAPPGPLLEIGTGARPMLDDVFTDRPRIAADLALPVLEYQAKGSRVCLDATRPLPFAAGSVAGVVVGELIEHVFYPDALIREVVRVLAPGGVLVLTTPNLATLPDRLRFLFGYSPRQVDPLHPYLHLHIRPFTVRQLRRLLRQCGLEPGAVRSNFVGLQLGRDRWLLSRTLARLFPGLGGSLVVSARRRMTIG